MKKLNKDNKGFSLVELLVVIAIMVVLVGVVAPTLLNNIEKSKEAKDIQYLDSIASAVQSSLTNEKAFDEISKNATTAVNATTLYTNTTDFKNTSEVIKDYFAQADIDVKNLGGANVDAADTIMVQYKDGHIIVYVKDTDKGSLATEDPAKTAEALKGKRGTVYYVSR
jgi:type IV pilus assembly protein PilA